jgi:hypothetical protein
MLRPCGTRRRHARGRSPWQRVQLEEPCWGRRMHCGAPEHSLQRCHGGGCSSSRRQHCEHTLSQESTSRNGPVLKHLLRCLLQRITRICSRGPQLLWFLSFLHALTLQICVTSYTHSLNTTRRSASRLTRTRFSLDLRHGSRPGQLPVRPKPRTRSHDRAHLWVQVLWKCHPCVVPCRDSAERTPHTGTRAPGT